MPPEWKETVFTMLPKAGDLKDPSNWRPIAILQVCYKIFARLLYNRLKGVLEHEQTDEQMGLRPHRSTVDALLILEPIVGQSLEYRMPLWFASLDLRKAFDRLEWGQLFQALELQGVPDQYRHLLAALYDDQASTIPNLGSLCIRRGVKQGDIISPLLFKIALQFAVDNWKTRHLNDHGWLLNSSFER